MQMMTVQKYAILNDIMRININNVRNEQVFDLPLLRIL